MANIKNKFVKKVLVSIIAVSIFSVGSYAGAVYSGLAANQGYFTGNIYAHGVEVLRPEDRGGDVWLAIPRTVSAVGDKSTNASTTLVGFLYAANHSGNAEKITGSAFIVYTMLGYDAATGRLKTKSVSDSDWDSVTKRLNNVTIDWSYQSLHANYTNTRYQGYKYASGYVSSLSSGGADDVAYYNQSGADPHGSETSIRMTDGKGKVYYELFYRCANPIGELPGLPEPEVTTEPITPTFGNDGCRPINISATPGKDGHGNVVPVTVTIDGNSSTAHVFYTTDTIDVSESYTDGNQHWAVYSTPEYFLHYYNQEDPDYNKPKYGVDGKPILDSSGNQTYETKTVQYEATEPAHTSNPSAIGPCYNYVLTAKIKNLQKHYIDADSTIDIYASVDSAKQDSDYPQTKSVDNTIWQITELIADPDFSIKDITAANVNSNDSPCDQYKGSTGIACSSPLIISSQQSVVGVGGGYYSHSFAVGDYAAGTKICFVFSVNPSASYVSNWNHSAFDSLYDCAVVTKKPKVQIIGGNLSVGGLVDTSTSIKNSRMLGSWTEYGVFAVGSISGMASGSAFASVAGLDGYSVCSYSTLSFTNVKTGASACSNSADMIGYYAGANTTASVASSFSGGNTIADNSIVANDLLSDSGTYIGNKTGDLTLSASNLAAGKSIILKVNGTATIDGNQIYENKTYYNAGELPQLIIIANNINITDNVTNIDAWLIATDGNINTCSNFPGNLTVNKCTNLLTVNGPVSARKILLYRTAGSGTGVDSGNPAEVFNLRADTYLWSAAYTGKNTKVQSVYTTELPPRF